MQTASGGPIFPWQQNTEWVNDWKFRTTPASRSKVLSGKGYFPMGDKVFNPNISENIYTPEQMENFKKLFIQRWKQ